MSYRLGLIDYTNVAPINQPLGRLGLAIGRGVPSQVNQALQQGRVDLANISAMEFLRHADQYAALPDFSVSVLGAVYSVNLFHRCEWRELAGKKIAYTSHSASSVQLLRTLLAFDGIQAELEQADGDIQTLFDMGYAAVLRIGDEALQLWYQLMQPTHAYQLLQPLTSASGIQVSDLAMHWYQHTQLPFVFAVWAYRRDNPPPPELVSQLREARQWGLGHLAEISEQQAQRLKLPDWLVQHYLWNFRYHLEAPDRAGLERFAQVVGIETPLVFGDYQV